MVWFTVIGVFIGVLSSLFGLGGGFVVVPILYVFLPSVVPAEYVMHTAVGTSLAVMVINSANSTYNHAKKGNINFDHRIHLFTCIDRIFDWRTNRRTIGEKMCSENSGYSVL
ncbi:Sulfite exporter TauE/SafE [Paenibacillus sp. cl141a]|uniref:sulfite exporter TauE/SafE family protein n=1 Tax=Paenibacillus sp. cl141a TaxID=1761877 RepID=UPI0008ACBB46|nr:sulfite exporter TauE/SafE family protein [Paenibacillus sp. cl141a]SEM58603.1 Sulfite exporter TauE/SafE [Paenibacillus sp. cl141a]